MTEKFDSMGLANFYFALEPSAWFCGPWSLDDFPFKDSYQEIVGRADLDVAYEIDDGCVEIDEVCIAGEGLKKPMTDFNWLPHLSASTIEDIKVAIRQEIERTTPDPDYVYDRDR
jgi:hypothetical protein